MSNDSVRRIMAEVKEFNALNKSPTTFFHAAPLESDLFEWHFSVRGPPDTPFADGVYHGRIVLPAEYPLKPPEIILLTPNGRFEVGKRICLSVTAHHQETWQPSWGIRTILTALVGFMPSKAEGLAALDFPDSDRRRLARLSWSFLCKRCGARPIQQLHVPAANKGGFPGSYVPESLEGSSLLSSPTSENAASSSATGPTASDPTPETAPFNKSTSPASASASTSGSNPPEPTTKVEAKFNSAQTANISTQSTFDLHNSDLQNHGATVTRPEVTGIPQENPTTQTSSTPVSLPERDTPDCTPETFPSNSTGNLDESINCADSCGASESPLSVPNAVSTGDSSTASPPTAPSPSHVTRNPQPLSPSSTRASPRPRPIIASGRVSRETVREPELLYLAYAIAVAIFAIILRRVYVSVTTM